jgi:hypothetical protein
MRICLDMARQISHSRALRPTASASVASQPQTLECDLARQDPAPVGKTDQTRLGLARALATAGISSRLARAKAMTYGALSIPIKIQMSVMQSSIEHQNPFGKLAKATLDRGIWRIKNHTGLSPTGRLPG